MEQLRQIRQTLNEIDRRIPDALLAAFGLGHRASRTPEDDAVVCFVASLMEPRPPEHGDDCPVEPDDETRGLRMDWASCYLPDHDEDAHFGHAGGDGGGVGVADGVGGYRKRGVDAGAFARGLMASAFADAVAPAEPGEPVCPHTMLEGAYEATAESGAPGASTAVVVSLAGEALRWAYVGDSGFAVLRGGRILCRSRRQQSGFNCPLQLSGRGGGDGVANAETGEMAARRGDVVVVGTDGLFDNMFDAELEKVVRVGTTLGFSAKNMADVIAGIAYEMSESEAKDSPFTIDCRKHGEEWRGGKLDDITVIVALIA